MWELMSIGLEMQERMIAVHGKGLEMARDMFDATETPAEISKVALEMGEAVNRAGQAQADMASRWVGFWSGRS